jgi:hypothetical protein
VHKGFRPSVRWGIGAGLGALWIAGMSAYHAFLLFNIDHNIVKNLAVEGFACWVEFTYPANSSATLDAQRLKPFLTAMQAITLVLNLTATGALLCA